MEDCEGWWLSGCRGSVAEHWWLKPEVSWVRLPVAAGFFTFLYFHFITSKFFYFQCEARCSQQNCKCFNLESFISAKKHCQVLPMFPLSSLHYSALDRNGSTWFELSRNVNTNRTAPNRSKQDLQPPSNWIELERSRSWCKRNRTTRSNPLGTRDWLPRTCWSKWLQIELMRRLSGFKSRCALTTPSV